MTITGTHETPDSFVLRRELVLMLRIQLPLLRLTVHEEVTTKGKVNICLAELEALVEDRLKAHQNLESYSPNIQPVKRVRLIVLEK